MGEEKYFKVKGSVEMTVMAATGEEAIGVVEECIGRTDHPQVYGSLTDRDDFTTEEIEFDPEGMAKMERWLAGENPS